MARGGAPGGAGTDWRQPPPIGAGGGGVRRAAVLGPQGRSPGAAGAGDGVDRGNLEHECIVWGDRPGYMVGGDLPGSSSLHLHGLVCHRFPQGQPGGQIW